MNIYQYILYSKSSVLLEVGTLQRSKNISGEKKAFIYLP